MTYDPDFAGITLCLRPKLPTPVRRFCDPTTIAGAPKTVASTIRNLGGKLCTGIIIPGRGVTFITFVNFADTLDMETFEADPRARNNPAFPRFLLLRRRLVMTTRKLMALSCVGTALIVAGVAFADPVAEGGRKFVTALTGQAELDGGALTADMDGRGTAHVFVNVGQRRVCWNLVDLANLDPLIASHIHQAPSNAAGPIRIAFFHFGEPIDLEGCTEGSDAFPFDRARLKDIIQHPENYYVNVHTSVYPGGAIRGQLSKKRA
jgi:hypothetical protein